MSNNPNILPSLRELDRRAYLACLFLPADAREAIASLWAFNAEVDRIRDLISEPLPGEIRLQWWRDVATGLREEEGQRHPIGAPLLEAIETHQLPKQTFDALCDARIFDLYDDPMPDRATLEGYLGETRSILFQMSAGILGEGPPENGDAAGHAGIALGIAELLQKMALYRARGQVFIPQDVLQAGGLDAAEYLALADASKADASVAAFVALGREHLAKAQHAIAELPKPQRAAFMQLGICKSIFNSADKLGGRIALQPLTLSPLTLQWQLYRYSFQL